MRIFWAVSTIAFAIATGAATAYPAGFDGTWQANGQSVGIRCSTSWFVRLTVANGQATGIVSIGAGTQNLENVVLRPDGSFSATAAPAMSTGGSRSRLIQAGQVSGKLTGDTITLTFNNPTCGTREAKGTRLSQ